MDVGIAESVHLDAVFRKNLTPACVVLRPGLCLVGPENRVAQSHLFPELQILFRRFRVRLNGDLDPRLERWLDHRTLLLAICVSRGDRPNRLGRTSTDQRIMPAVTSPRVAPSCSGPFTQRGITRHDGTGDDATSTYSWSDFRF